MAKQLQERASFLDRLSQLEAWHGVLTIGLIRSG